MAKKDLQRLDPDIEEKAYEMILAGKKLDEVAKAMGLKTRRDFQKYQMLYPEFQDLVQRALLAECQYIEEEIRHVADKYNKEYARIELEALSKLLKFRNPQRYGDKVNIDVSMTVDIAGAIERAERRVIEANVTNVIAISAKKDPEK